MRGAVLSGRKSLSRSQAGARRSRGKAASEFRVSSFRQAGGLSNVRRVLFAPNTLNFPVLHQAEPGPETSWRVPESREPPPVAQPIPTGYHRWWSPRLHQDRELQVFGHAGPVLLAFPPSGGRFFDFDHNGLIGAAESLLAAGRLRLVCLDSADAEGWAQPALPLARRAAHADAFDAHVVGEVVPFLRHELSHAGPFGTLGCSLGAYHAANLLFRHPDVFQTCLGLSGLYDLVALLGGDWHGPAYFHSPLHYLPNLTDPWFLDRIRTARLTFAAGRGPGEENAADHTRRLGEVLAARGLPAWIDLWGDDVTHDWTWWRRMLPYFLDRMFVDEKG